MLKAYAVSHRGVGGEGTGITAVVARNARHARQLVKDYLDRKPNGQGARQCSSAALLEVEEYDYSTLCSHPMSTESSGVKVEYWFRPDCAAPDVVYLHDHESFTCRLDELQAVQNQGRGVDCLRTVCLFLRRGEFGRARSCVLSEMDKIGMYPELVALLSQVGFWYQL